MYNMNTADVKKPGQITGRILAGYRMYNVEELARLLQITTVSVRAYIRTGKLKGQRIGRGYYVSEEALKDFLGVK